MLSNNYFASTPIGSEAPSQYYCGVPADPTQQDLYRQQTSVQIEIGKAERKSYIRRQEREHQESVKNEGEEVRAMERADIARKKELLKTRVLLHDAGNIEIVAEMFGKDSKEVTGYILRRAVILSCDHYDDSAILYIMIQNKNGRESSIFLKISELTEKNVRRKFTSAGINFGFSNAKESQIRMMLVNTVYEIARYVTVPPHHGWYCESGILEFAFPEEITWKEAMKYASLMC